MARTPMPWSKTREGAKSALWQAQDEHAGLQFDIQRGVLTDNLYVLTVYPLGDSTAAPLGTKSARTMAEVKRKAEGYRREYRLGRLLNPRKRQRKKAAKYQAFLFYAEENETAPIGTFSTLPRARAAVDKWVAQSSGWTPWGGVYKGDELVYEKKWAKGNPPVIWEEAVELASRAGAAAKRAGRRIKRKVRPPKGPPSTEELLFRAEDWKNKSSWHPSREWPVYLRAALADAQRAHQQASKEGDRDMEWAAGRLASSLRRELRTLEKKKNPGRTPPSRDDQKKRMEDARKMLHAARAIYRREPDLAIDMATTAIRMVYSGGPYDEPYGRLGQQIDYDAEKFVREIYKECLSKVKANPTLSRAEMSEFWSRAADERLAEAMGFADVYEWQEWKGKDKDKGDDSAHSVVQRVIARAKAKAARKKNPRGTTTTAQARAVLRRAMRGT